MTHNDLANFESRISDCVDAMAASPRRKRIIREELLAHMSEVYDEEFGRHGKSRLAAKAVQERFGDPSDLFEQIQASVPFFESFVFTYVLRREALMSRWLIVAVVALLGATAIAIPDSTEFVVGALLALVGVGFARQCQQSRALGRHWPWMVGVLAALTGPAMILPALAKLKQHAIDAAGMPGPHLFKEQLLGPLALGAFITVGGLALIVYGIGKNWSAERA